jgi:hypothetical protein
VSSGYICTVACKVVTYIVRVNKVRQMLFLLISVSSMVECRGFFNRIVEPCLLMQKEVIMI